MVAPRATPTTPGTAGPPGPGGARTGGARTGGRRTGGSQLHRVARGGAANLAGSVVAAAAGFGVTWVAARVLPSAQAGVLFAATAVFVLVGSVAKLGTPTGLVYWIARLRALDQHHLLDALLRVALYPVAVAGLLAGAALWLAAGWLAGVAEPGHAAEYAGQLRVLAEFLPVAALGDTLLAATRGYRAIRPTVYVDRLLRPGLQLVGFAVLGLLAAGHAMRPGLTAFSLAWALPYAPAALLTGLALARLRMAGGRDAPNRRGAMVVEWRVARTNALLVDGVSVARRFWGFTGPRAVAGVLQTALQRVDVVLVAALAGFGATAVYSVAGRFVLVGQLVNQAISQSVQPRLAELLSTGNRPAARRLYQGATAWLVLLAWPPCLLTGVFASLYLGLFGPGYGSATAVVAVLAGAVLLASACGMVDMVLAMAGRTTWNLANVALALAVLIGVDVAAVPRMGALGAAIGLAAAIATNNLVPLAQIGMLLRLHPFGPGTLGACALALGWFGALPLAVVALAGSGPASLAGCLAVGGTGYATCCWRWRRGFGLIALRPPRTAA
jgi:O-antigen/teichoic acid export membrane protein